MLEYVLVWVLVIAPSTSQNSPFISAPVSDVESCQRMREAVAGDSYRRAQCVQVWVPVITVPKK